MSISTTAITMPTNLIMTNLHCNQAIQTITPATNGSVSTAATTSILLFQNTGTVTNFTVTFPPSPTNGQFFTMLQATTASTAIVNLAGTGGAAFVNPVNTLNPAANPTSNANGASVTYIYSSSSNTWYRFGRG